MQGFQKCKGEAGLVVKGANVKIIGRGEFRGCGLSLGKTGRLPLQHKIPYIVLEGDMDTVYIGHDCLRAEGLDSTVLVAKVMRG